MHDGEGLRLALITHHRIVSNSRMGKFSLPKRRGRKERGGLIPWKECEGSLLMSEAIVVRLLARARHVLFFDVNKGKVPKGLYCYLKWWSLKVLMA